MNWLKKGPELKMPKLKGGERRVPGPVLDVYYELKERHLLPLVVVLLVAIVAVPIALSEGSDAEEEAGSGGAVASASGAPAADRSRVVVAQSIPGLRDYKRRLQDQTAKDPFAVPGGAKEAEEAIDEVEEALEDALDGSEGSGEPKVTHTLTYYSWEIDVRVVPVSTNGKPSKADPSVRNNLPELTMLPGRDTPALVFLGPTKDGEKALMLVSSNVKAIFGDAICVLGGETCQMLALEKGIPETFVYGGNERIFRIELRDIQLVATKERNAAPLGDPKGGGDPSTAVAPSADAFSSE